MPSRAIPTITNEQEMKAYLKNYQQTIGQAIKSAPTPIAPYNFKATNQRGGIKLDWSPLVYPTSARINKSPTNTAASTGVGAQLSKADGYEIQRSTTGDFSPGNYVSIPLRDPTQNTYFDSVGGVAQTFYYRLRATNGTQNNPYSIHGLFTQPVKHTSIDASDVATTPSVVRDNFTNSTTQARARNWPQGVNSPFQ